MISLQQLGLVGGLGLAAVALSGCETKLEATPYYGETNKVCNQGERKSFIRAYDVMEEISFVGIPFHSKKVRTIEEEFGCEGAYSYHLATEVNCLLEAREVLPDGTRREVDNRVYGGVHQL